jgi:hypothetical protein
MSRRVRATGSEVTEVRGIRELLCLVGGIQKMINGRRECSEGNDERDCIGNSRGSADGKIASNKKLGEVDEVRDGGRSRPSPGQKNRKDGD